MKRAASAHPVRTAAGLSQLGAACLTLSCLGLAGASWSKEPAPVAGQGDAAPAAEVESVAALTAGPPKKAPPVDLGEPVTESAPLQVVEESIPEQPEPEKVTEKNVQSSEPVVARSVDLGEPVTEPLPEPAVETAAETPLASAATAEAPVAAAEVAAPADEVASPAAAVAAGQTAIAGSAAEVSAVSAPPPEAVEVTAVAAAPTGAQAEPADVTAPLVMLGSEVAPATSTRLSWSPSHSFEGIAVPTPVLVVHGARPGPALCLTAAVHGDELNGIEIVRRILYNLNAEKLSGTVIGVPIVNLQGFRRGSRYLPDRRDLNRFFPGDPTGSSAARIAHSFFNEVIGHCDALVDLHTGSFYRTNLPQLRADLRDTEVLELSQGFDGTVVLQSEGSPGTLRQAAVAAGIPAVTLEAGEPLRLQEKEVNHGVKTIQSLLGKLGMVRKSGFWGEPEPVYYQSAWVRADHGGILFSEVGLGERVRKDEVLGTVTDPITNVRTEILSPYRGRVLGMALNQVVMPGFAAFRIGIQASDSEVIDTSNPEPDAPAALHTSQIEKERKSSVAKAATEFEEYEGLEDSE